MWIFITRGILFLLWLGIWIDYKRTKVNDSEEGWSKDGPGYIKRFRPKAKVVKLDDYEAETYHSDLTPVQSN